MRIAIGGIVHETNTMFGPPTPVEEFQRQHWEAGEEIRQLHTGVRSPFGGMLDAAAELGVEIIPTFSANAHPSGTIERAAFEQMRDLLLDGIRAAMPVDAVVLSLHGAGSAEGDDDIEGHILAAVRDLIGPDMPLVSTLDLHGHSTQRMVDNATSLLNVHEYPHVDGYERGHEALHLAAKAAAGEVKPVMHLTLLPMAIPPTNTFHGVLREVNERCWEWEAGDGVIDVALVHGYPHSDVPIISASVMVTTDNNPELAKRAAEDIARYVWERRAEILVPLPTPEEAVARGMAAEQGPVVIAEISDNPGGGAPGDSVHLLKALIDADVQNSAFGFVVDPETVEQAHAAGVGATIHARIGGKVDAELMGPPIEVDAVVRGLTDGTYVVTSVMGRGATRTIGRTARLQVGGLAVIVATESHQTIDPGPFLMHGIDVSTLQIAALKSQNHFRAAFEPLASEIIRTDPPGWTTSTLSQLPFKRITRPIWPLDDVQDPGI